MSLGPHEPLVRRRCTVVLTAALVLCVGIPVISAEKDGARPEPGNESFFRSQVQPILRARCPVDAFILARLEAEGLEPAQPADRVALIRRVTYDLTGLPPTPKEVDEFCSDQSSNAYERLVDRLLASPRYGEAWGRHWLDL